VGTAVVPSLDSDLLGVLPRGQTLAVGRVLVVHHQERFHVARAGANRFDLVRTGSVWEILHRTTRALDGDAAARELLAVVR
jgi:hypothetical protein